MFGYFEKRDDARRFKEAYASDIKAFISQRFAQQTQERTSYMSGIAQDPEAYRADFRNMLGFPLNCSRCMAHKATLSKLVLLEDEEKVIYRATITVLDTIRFSGLLFLHKDGGSHPFIIAQHGGSGSPELCSGFFAEGSGNYNDMTERIFRHGANVFAPQLLLWSEKYETEGYCPEDRVRIDAQLKQLGGSIAALEVYCIMKSLDALCEASIADEEHLGMIGLSYGGFYTLFTAAADPRIKAAFSCSQFNKREHYPWFDWTWRGSAGIFFDAEAAMLVYPRYLCVAVGDQDALFDAKLAETEFQRLHQLSETVYDDTGWFDTCVFSGVHEFIKTDDLIQKVIAEVSK